MTFSEQFDYEVAHRAGVKHGNADGLSRRPAEELDIIVRIVRQNEKSTSILEGEDLREVNRKYYDLALKPKQFEVAEFISTSESSEVSR